MKSCIALWPREKIVPMLHVRWATQLPPICSNHCISILNFICQWISCCYSMLINLLKCSFFSECHILLFAGPRLLKGVRSYRPCVAYQNSLRGYGTNVLLLFCSVHFFVSKDISHCTIYLQNFTSSEPFVKGITDQ